MPVVFSGGSLLVRGCWYDRGGGGWSGASGASRVRLVESTPFICGMLRGSS